MITAPHQIVIVGGGFGGLYAARSLRRAAAEVTLIDRRNFHLFQPLLYQVATGGLSPANIAAPLRFLVHKQKNTRVIMAEVIDIDTARRILVLEGGELPYDSLIIAAGSQFNYFGHDEWAAVAPGLKTLEDATAIRRRVLAAFEKAEREDNPARVSEELTFIVIGGGPTGVEMAGALAELARHTLRHDFRSIDTAQAKVLLVEAGPRLLGTFSEALSVEALKSLAQLGVEVLTSTMVIDVDDHAVTIRHGEEDRVIHCGAALWTAGVKAAKLAAVVSDATGTALDGAGRIIVGSDCRLPGHPEIFAIGDIANHPGPDGKPLPGLAPVAMQQGRYVARAILAKLQGITSAEPFKYKDKGTMATIGRARAVANLHGHEFSGFFAWLLWLFVHLMYVAQFQNRVLVLTQWAWNYFTRSRSARLITYDDEKHATRAGLARDAEKPVVGRAT